MKLFSNLKIGHRMGLGFATIVMMALCVGVIGIARLSAIAEELVAIKEAHVPTVQQVAVLADNLNQAAQVLRNALIFEEPAKVADMLKLAQQKIDLMDEAMAKLTQANTSAEGQQRLAAVRAGRDAFVPAKTEFVALMAAGKKAEATILLVQKMRPDQLAYKQAIDALYAHHLAYITQTATNGEAGYHQARTQMLGLLGLMAGLAVWIARVSARSISEPLARAVGIAERVAAGHLDSNIQVKTKDEIGALFAALRKMNNSLTQIVGKVRSSADCIATGSAQIATGNADLSQRTEAQASNLQQTAASMEELTATVKQNADTARQANEMVAGAGEAAAKGGAVVGEVVGTMRNITDASRKIVEIIGVIDGIAFQTNILALNAAVEAARAGEQGRGFAVVASEVRSLAQRSATAAKAIKSLIDESVAKVESGSRLVDAAGRSMDDIVAQVERVSGLIAEISAASVEQAQGIGQVSNAVQQLDQVTQQNAALVEQSAAAAESLKTQAGELLSAVSVFQLGTRPGTTHDTTHASEPALA